MQCPTSTSALLHLAPALVQPTSGFPRHIWALASSGIHEAAATREQQSQPAATKLLPSRRPARYVMLSSLPIAVAFLCRPLPCRLCSHGSVAAWRWLWRHFLLLSVNFATASRGTPQIAR